MVNTALKYGLQFDTYDPSQDLLKELPLWHSFAEDKSKRKINNTAPCKCLRSTHRAYTLGDAMVISERLSDPAHRADNGCMCHPCILDRVFAGCKNPHSCAKMAKLKLDSLLPKWDPRR
ncbi:hypothetical protein C8R44DRAFT_542958, partial [Mycena epipterygia]